ncbi:MAG: undecaprenyl-diphosphate phosphatase [Microgenomates group bacterium]
MSPLQALILGIVEGITEFLPVSSTAHLIITSNFLGLTQSEFTSFFEVFIQSGAILAVVVLYFRYILSHKELIKPIIASFIPTAVIGLLLHSTIKTTFFNSPTLIYSSLIAIGVVFLVLEYFVKNGQLKLSKRLENISLKDALLFGFFQACAVVPGVSRAGAVMVGAMVRGYKREEAALYSFLLAIPTILAAGVLDFLKTDLTIITQSGHIQALSIGFITSFITAYLVLKWFIGYLQRNTLVIFGIYRIILGIALLTS